MKYLYINEKIKGCMFKALLVSGNANNGTNAGVLYTNTNNAASNTNTNIGGQLDVK